MTIKGLSIADVRVGFEYSTTSSGSLIRDVETRVRISTPALIPQVVFVIPKPGADQYLQITVHWLNYRTLLQFPIDVLDIRMKTASQVIID